MKGDHHFLRHIFIVSGIFTKKSEIVMQSPHSSKPAQQEQLRSKRRQYTSRACAECRRRKVKCSGGTPCANCTVTVSVCRYEERRKQCRGGKKRTAAASTSIDRGQEHDISGIVSRMRALEEEVHALRLSVWTDHPSNKHKIRPIDNDQMEPTGSYDCEGNNQERIDRLSIGAHVRSSLASQLRVLQNAVPQQVNADVPEDDTLPDVQTASYYPSVLADTVRLKSSVRVFFEECAYLFPCLQLDEFCPRLFNLFQICPSGPYGLLLPIECESEISLAALSCMVLAASELLRTDRPPDSVDCHSHQTWYRESQRLRRLHPKRPLRDLDILRTYIVEAMYKLGLERLSESSLAIAQAVELAFTLGLNDERSWLVQTDASRKRSRMLWWTLYSLDRSLAHKTGRPYLIHDNDAAVVDFLDDINCHDGNPQSQHQEDGSNHVSEFLTVSPDYLSDRDWYWYLQFCVQWGRLFSRIWDNILAVKASQCGDIEAMEAFDSSVLRLRRSIPFSLDWEAHSSTALSERKARLQLLIFTRINVIRLLIRSSGLRDNHSLSSTFNPIRTSMDWEHNTRLCQDLVTSTIAAIVTYMRVRPFQRVMGIYSTLVLLQCLYYIVHLAECWSLPNGLLLKDKSIETAVLCLKDMAATGLPIAQHSLNVLGHTVCSRSPAPPPQSLSSSFNSDDSPARQTNTPRSANGFMPSYPQFSLHDNILQSQVTNPAIIDLYKSLGLTGADV